MTFNYQRYGSYTGSNIADNEKTGRFDTESSRLIGDSLYAFSSFVFTSAGTNGYTGPTLATFTSSYNTTSNPWLLNTSFYNVVTNGIQEWTVPASGTYRIRLVGATGGIHGGSYFPAFPGAGATVQFDYPLSKGDILNIVVGQKPTSTTGTSGNGAAGGGASWVYTGSIGGSGLIGVAGGGGGTGHGGNSNKGGNGRGGSNTTNSRETNEGDGYGINFRYGNRSCGNNGIGQGGKSANTGGFTLTYRSGGGGAGWLSDGDDYPSYGRGGDRFIGGISEDSSGMYGGFGGGGGAGGTGNSGGGGGGYTGGGSGDGWKSINAGGNTSNSWGGGAGGGSYSPPGASNVTMTAGNDGINYADTGPGQVTITLL